MLLRPEVPAKVAINEALELAKRYSTAQSSRFVNGILDRVLQLNAASQAGDQAADAATGGADDLPAAARPGCEDQPQADESASPPL